MLTTGMIIVFAIVALAVILFIFEPIPIDVTALLVLLLLAILGRWTGISPEEAVSGFSNPATITVLAMLVLSAGVQRSGLIPVLGRYLTRLVGDSERKQLAATVGLGGPISGFINNTPVVALLIPVVTDMANKGRVSPSRLLIPLSYASMMGGMLTLVGTSTNILASDLSRRLLDHEMEMFEFAGLGAIVLVVGGVYLLLAAPRLLPERIKPDESYLEDYALTPYFSELRIRSTAPMVGKTIGEWLEQLDMRVDIISMIRDDVVFDQPLANKVIRPGDVLLVHARRKHLDKLMASEAVELVSSPKLTPDEILSARGFDSLVEVVVPADSRMVGRSISDIDFPDRFGAFVLAVRTGGETIRERIQRQELRSGDTLLLQATREGNRALQRNPDLIALRTEEVPVFRRRQIPLALGIVAGVVLLATFEVLPIMVAALAGVVAMLLTRLLSPAEMYAAVDWRVIFLLAGIIPLGMALEQTGAASLLGQLVAQSAHYLPIVVVLWLFYIGTGLITEVISNNASVLLMIPVAIETATYVGANPFAFVLAVMFAASTAFLGPVGYQTNLFVYGPGGYKISDFLRIGAPLQLLLSVVTVAGIAVFWGV